MSLNGGFNPFKKRETAEKPSDATEALRSLLAQLDAKHGSDAVNDAIDNFQLLAPSEKDRLHNFPPVHTELLEGIERLRKDFDEPGEVMMAMLAIEDERGVLFPNNAPPIVNEIDREGINTAFEVLLPKVEAIADKDPHSLTEGELDSLIEESNSIELHSKNANIFGALVTLRNTLFRPEFNHSNDTPESAMQKLKDVLISEA